MQIPAYAKINWSLNILSLRPDGYHEMDMVMQPISLCDVLTIEPAEEILFDGPDGDLVPRAARSLNAFAGTRHGAALGVDKRIPQRAGLGGGSADAAATLDALNRMWRLGLPAGDLGRIAATLGADVPFCLGGVPARAQGIGERLTPIDIAHTYELVLIHPGAGLSTPRMFQMWDAEAVHSAPADTEGVISALQSRDFAALEASARNMLYGCAVRELPDVARARESLISAGARFAAMTGSGSAVFGVFATAEDADRAAQRIGPAAIRAHTR